MENNNGSWFCPKCGAANSEKFCAKCGTPRPQTAVNNSGAQNQAPRQKPAVFNAPPQARPQRYSNETRSSTDNTSKYFIVGALAAILIAGGIGFGLYKAGMIGGADKPQTEMAQTSSNKTASKESSQPAKSEAKAESSKPASTSELSLGGIGLGDTFDSASKQLGREKKSEPTKDGSVCHYFEHMQVFVKNGTIVGLVSEDSSVKSLRGIGQGDPASAVFEKYGKDYYITEYDGKNLYEYTFSGKGVSGILRFAVNKSDNNVSYVSLRLN